MQLTGNAPLNVPTDPWERHKYNATQALIYLLDTQVSIEDIKWIERKVSELLRPIQQLKGN